MNKPAAYDHLFILDLIDYSTRSSIHLCLADLIADLINMVRASDNGFFTDKARTAASEIIEDYADTDTPSSRTALLDELREVLEDSHYAVFITSVAVPTSTS